MIDKFQLYTLNFTRSTAIVGDRCWWILHQNRYTDAVPDIHPDLG